MATFEVMIHTKRGCRFIMEADSATEAERAAERAFVDDGDDGIEGGYERILVIETVEVRP